MENVQNHFKFEGEQKEHVVILREGVAPEVHEPEIVVISGTIKAPGIWAKKRKSQIDPLKSHLLFDKEKGQIRLNINETDHFGTQITGSLKKAKWLEVLGINDEKKKYRPSELGDLLKKHKFLFTSFDLHATVVSGLKQFEGTIEKKLKNNDDNRGNLSVAIEQTVKSSIPESFKVKFPLFVGYPDVEVETFIFIEASQGSPICSLVSYDLYDIIEQKKNEIFDAELDAISELIPELPVIEL